MPYGSTSELPADVKDNLPGDAAEIFKEAFNSAYEGTCEKDDACSAKVAWSAVKGSFYQNEDGKWVKKDSKLNKTCPGCKINKTESHDAILQMLDRPVGKLLFNKEPFIPTVEKWNGIPMIFSQNHPDPFGLMENIESELLRVDGAIVGDLSEARLDNTGHPKLMAKENFTDATAIRLFEEGKISKAMLDKSKAAVGKAVELLSNGKLSHSTGFLCPDDGTQLYGVVNPNHHLVFEEIPGKAMPLDLGSVILNNSTSQPSATASAITTGTTTAGGVHTWTDSGTGGFPYYPYSPSNPKRENELPGGESLIGQLNNTRLDEERKRMDEKEKAALIKENNEKLAAKDTEIATLKSQVEQLIAEQVKVQKAKEDAEWLALKNEFIPPGLVKTPEDEAALRKLCKEDSVAFTKKVMSVRPDPKRAQGTPHLNKQEDTSDKQHQTLETVRELRRVTGR